MQNINFTLSNFTRFDLGKWTTIRLGQKDYNLGPVVLTCDEEQLERQAEIIEIRIVRFGDLGLSDAVADGFNTVEMLRHELQQVYRKFIPDHDVVTVVRFKV